MWEKVVIHSYIEYCYAQIEEVMYPQLKKVPMVVVGSQNNCREIVLSRNFLAKTYRIQTGDSLRDAYKKCPHLVVMHPHYDDYLYYTEEVKNIYREYTNDVESIGLDQAWIDITSSQGLFGGNPIHIAKQIQQRVYKELGLTISLGISFNKCFAKLGNHMNKHMEIQVVSKDNYKKVIYPLPVEVLLDMGETIISKLKVHGIYTIGDIANSDKKFLQSFLDYNGERIWCLANGIDDNQKDLADDIKLPKSIGNRITAYYDLTTFEDVKSILQVLSESVATRLQDYGLKGTTVTLQMRDNQMNNYIRTKSIHKAINTFEDIMKIAEELLLDNCDRTYQSVSLRIGDLSMVTDDDQLNLFVKQVQRYKEKYNNFTMNEMKNRYDFTKLKRSYTGLFQSFTHFHTKQNHTMHSKKLA